MATHHWTLPTEPARVAALVAALVLLGSLSSMVLAAPASGGTSLASSRIVNSPTASSTLLSPAIASGSGWGHTMDWTRIPEESGVPDYPGWLAYDNATHAFYVAVDPADSTGFGTVDVVTSGTSEVSDSILVGLTPFAVAFDSLSGNLFVTNTGSNNVSVLDGTTNAVTAAFAVGESPSGIAYDNATDSIYVADGGSNNVEVFDATSLSRLAIIAVGADPIGVVYDPVDRDVYVADSGSNSVSVISGSTNQVIATIAAGTNPYALAVDNATDEVYVSNQGSANVSVIAAVDESVITSINVSTAGSLYGIAYDPADRTIWVDGEYTYVAVIDTATNEVEQVLVFDPEGAAYDSDSGQVCVTNAANATFACFTGPPIPGPYSVTFRESGAPPSAVGISFNGSDFMRFNSGGTLTFGGLEDGSYDYSTPPSTASYLGGYNLTSSSLTSPVIVNGANVTVSLVFRGWAEVQFFEDGLPPNGSVNWSVTLGGITRCSMPECGDRKSVV